MGRSREPPVLARFGRTSDETNVARVAGYTPKRLPSSISNPQTRVLFGLGAVLQHSHTPSLRVAGFEDEDDDEDENEAPLVFVHAERSQTLSC